MSTYKDPSPETFKIHNSRNTCQQQQQQQQQQPALPTPRSSLSLSPPPGEDGKKQAALEILRQSSNWPGRGRTPWRTGTCLSPHTKRKRRADSMASSAERGDDTAPKRAKQSVSRSNAMRSRSLEDVPFPTLDWRCREPTTSPKRKASPMRRLVHELENGSPKIVFNRSGGLPLHVKEIKQRFYKATREGYIPRSLRAVVENKAGEEVDEISEEAYGEYDIVGVHSMWFAVLEVYQSAQDCDRFTQDESAWCDDVVRPALQWEGAFPNFYKVLNLQTQSIYTDDLSTSTFGPIAIKKTDYGLAFSPNHDSVRPFYDNVSFSGRHICLSQMSDPYTQMLALMLGIEVKAQYGNEVEARAQLAVWLAAGLKHRRDVATAATGNAAAMDEVPMLGWTVIGHQWDLYMAFVESGSTGDVTILGPTCSVTTRSLHGVFQLWGLLREIKAYGREEYWRVFRDRILQPLRAKGPGSSSTTHGAHEKTLDS